MATCPVIDMKAFLEGLDSQDRGGLLLGPRVRFSSDAPVVCEVFSAEEYDRRSPAIGAGADAAGGGNIDGCSGSFIPRFQRLKTGEGGQGKTQRTYMTGLLLGLISPFLEPRSLLCITQTYGKKARHIQ